MGGPRGGGKFPPALMEQFRGELRRQGFITLAGATALVATHLDTARLVRRTSKKKTAPICPDARARQGAGLIASDILAHTRCGKYRHFFQGMRLEYDKATKIFRDMSWNGAPPESELPPCAWEIGVRLASELVDTDLDEY